MDNIADLKGKHILVLGYAVTGRSVASFLLDAGAFVTLNDYKEIPQDAFITSFENGGGKVVDKGHPISLLDGIDFIVKNPGIPYHIPLLEEAMRRGLPIITDIELASRYWPGDIVSVTGSNGKTTTVALIYHILKELKQGEAYLAGNIGTPVLDYLRKAQASDHLVMETSSFQLQGTISFHPHVAVITNLYEAHLDYHKTLKNYHQAKLKSVANLTQDDYFVYNYDQKEVVPYFENIKARQVPFSATILDSYIQEKGAYIDNGFLCFQGERVMPVSHIKLAGQHNIENVLAAIAVAKLYQVPNHIIDEVVLEYEGMPHRIQHVGTYGGIRVYNDSKATNIVATQTALKAFEQPIRYIGGGLDRGNEFDELRPYLSFVEGAYLYGESQEKLEKTFIKSGTQTVKRFATLEEATNAAIKDSKQGEVILFSPACASWDQYKNFEIRGEEFMEFVHKYMKEGI